MPQSRPDLSPARIPVGEDEEMRLLRRKADGLTVFLAGPANVLMQLSWTEVGHGVLESTVESGQVFRHPLKRFRTTIGYIGIALFGSEEERAAYREAVNGAHRAVRSGPDSPVKYNAFDRDLQLWVASCLYYGFRDTVVRMHGPLTDREEAVLLKACARFGTTLQVPAELWHDDVEEFRAYWERGLERASFAPAVADYLHRLLRMEMLPFPGDRLLRTPLGWLNTGFLPEPLRQKLGLRWSERDQRRHDRILRVLGMLLRPLPHRVRLFPMNTMRTNIRIRRKLGRPQV